MKFTRVLTFENLWQRDLLVASAGGEVQQLRFSQVSGGRAGRKFESCRSKS